MNLDISQLLVWATKRTFSAMLDWNVDAAPSENPEPPSDVSGIVGLSGDVTGSIVLIMPKTLAIAATEGLIGDSLDSVNGDVVDTVGELTNIIAGGAKSRIELKVNLSLPTVVTGRHHFVGYDSQVDPEVVRFVCNGEDFAVKYCIDAPSHMGITVAPAAEMAV